MSPPSASEASTETLHANPTRNSSRRFERKNAGSLPQPALLLSKQSEWQQLLKGLCSLQSQRCLLIGDAGLGKSYFLQQLHALLPTLNTPLEEASQGYPQHLSIFVDVASLAQATQPDAVFSLGDSLYVALSDLRSQLETLLLTGLQQACLNYQHAVPWEWSYLKVWLEEATLQPSQAEAEAYLRVMLRQHCYGQESLLNKLFAPHQEELDAYLAVLNQPWHYFLLSLETTWLPQVRTQRTSWGAVLVQMVEFSRQYFQPQATPFGITLLLDHWETLLPPANAPKQALLSQLQEELHQYCKLLNEKKQVPLHVVLATRSESLSQQLGSPLFNLFKTKFLLQGLSFEELLRLTQEEAILDSEVIQWSEDALQWLHLHGFANHWGCKMAYQRLNQQARKEARKWVDVHWLESLGLVHVSDVLDQDIAQLQLTLMQEAPSRMQAFLAVLKHVSWQPFNIPGLMGSLLECYPLMGKEDLLFAIKHLYLKGFIVSHPPLEGKETLPAYQIQHRMVLEVLQQRFLPTAAALWVEEALEQATLQEALPEAARSPQGFQGSDIPVEQQRQFQTLSHIVPQSLRQGELSEEKRRSITALMAIWHPQLQLRFTSQLEALLNTVVLDANLNEALRSQAIVASELLPLPLQHSLLLAWQEWLHSQDAPASEQGLLKQAVLQQWLAHTQGLVYGRFAPPLAHLLEGFLRYWVQWEGHSITEQLLKRLEEGLFSLLPSSLQALLHQEVLQQFKSAMFSQQRIPLKTLSLMKATAFLESAPQGEQLYLDCLNQLLAEAQEAQTQARPFASDALLSVLLETLKPLQRSQELYDVLMALWQEAALPFSSRSNVLNTCVKFTLQDADGVLQSERILPLIAWVDAHKALLCDTCSAESEALQRLLQLLVQRLTHRLQSNTALAVTLASVLAGQLLTLNIDANPSTAYLLAKSLLHLNSGGSLQQEALVRLQQHLQTFAPAQQSALQLLKLSIQPLLQQAPFNPQMALESRERVALPSTPPPPSESSLQAALAAAEALSL